MSGKKICINSTSSYYTGKEQSPLHFGLSAEGYEINSIMEGFDKELWIVEVRNNKKVWTKRDNINKMTYEIPLINESIDIKEADTINNTTCEVVSTPTIDAISQVIISSSPDTAEPRNDLNTLNSENNDDHKIKVKISKTIKPTDYTLFITYRIHQLKQLSNDNKKNYDDAREEWKEYKKNPSKLQSIMIEANNFSKIK
jgi:hypothetical protein